MAFNHILVELLKADVDFRRSCAICDEVVSALKSIYISSVFITELPMDFIININN